MVERRHYSARTKARAVGIALVEGVTETERQTGIPKVTVWQWMQDPAYEQLRTRVREDVMAEWWSGIQLGARHLVAGMENPDVPLRDKSQAFLALAQNYQLMSGAATSRTETKEITDGLTDDEKDQLRLAIRAAVGEPA